MYYLFGNFDNKQLTKAHYCEITFGAFGDNYVKINKNTPVFFTRGDVLQDY